LHARDVAVLELLVSHQIETLAFLHERHWPNCTRKSAYNRLRALANAGYLMHIKRPHPDETKTWVDTRPPSEHLFCLGPKAPTALRLRGRESEALGRRHRRGGISAALIDHQLATNRVAEILGVRLEQLPETGKRGQDRHRPDGYYLTEADERGRDRVLVEIDLGHYSRDRVIAKTIGFLGDEQARSILFVTSTTERAHLVARWHRERYGSELMQRLDVCSIAELKSARNTFAPDAVPPAIGRSDERWFDLLTGTPGCR
jgi:hypothetical protein